MSVDFHAVGTNGVLLCPRQIHIEYRLEVIGNNVLIAPGCEPTSVVTSATLARWNECGGSRVELAEALEAIPGSYIQYMMNMGESNGSRKRWFILPAYCPVCEPGCESIPDYYQILRDLARDDPNEEADESCEVIDQGFCPSTVDPVLVRTDPYKEEGNLWGFTPQLFNTPRDFSQPDLSDASNPYIDPGNI